MGHGRAAAARFTGTRAIASPRFVGAAGRSALRGRSWARVHGHADDHDALGHPRRRRRISSITRSTYRLLLTKGLTPDEAANLTAFLCGIPIAEVHWSLRQVNQLLFLREMARTGRFGPRDGEPPRPH